MKTLKIMMVALMMAIASSASAITYNQARQQALFLADKMAYELNLSEAQYAAAYKINLDYLMAVNSRRDIYGASWVRRNNELRSLFARWQYNKYVAANYFYRPVYWSNNTWNWRIYSRYSSNRWYNSRPSCYSSYRGRYYRDYSPRRSWRHRPRRSDCGYYESSCSTGYCNDRYDCYYDDDCYDCDYDDDYCDYDYDDDDYDYGGYRNYNSSYSTNSNVNINNNNNINNINNVINNGGYNRPPMGGWRLQF